MSLHADLIAIRKLVDTPEKWTQGAPARDASGNGVPFYSTEACSFCIIGAKSMAVWFDMAIGDKVLRSICAAAGVQKTAFDLAKWNDGLEGTHSERHEQFLAALDKAIEQARPVGL